MNTQLYCDIWKYADSGAMPDEIMTARIRYIVKRKLKGPLRPLFIIWCSSQDTFSDRADDPVSQRSLPCREVPVSLSNWR